MPPAAVFFDLDDTLIDSVTAMTSAWDLVCQDYASRFGCEAAFLRDAFRREGSAFWKDEEKVAHWRLDLIGAREVFVRRALEAEGFDPSDARLIAHQYAEHHHEHLQLFDDALSTIEALRAAGFRIGLITNGDGPPQRRKIEKFGLSPHFEVIVVEGEFGRGKPVPDVFLHAARSVGVEPAAAWHVGDNLYADVAGAQSAGLHGVWIHRDRLEPGESPAATPDRTIAHLAELRDALGCP